MWVGQLLPEDAEFLSQMPFSITFEGYDVIVVHGGLVPGVPLEQQGLEHLCALRDLLRLPDGRCVVGFAAAAAAAVVAVMAVNALLMCVTDMCVLFMFCVTCVCLNPSVLQQAACVPALLPSAHCGAISLLHHAFAVSNNTHHAPHHATHHVQRSWLGLERAQDGSEA